jgi:outer membrane lipoprotein SlyB
MKNILLPLLLLALLGCAKNVSQNNYNYNEVGQSIIVEFAQIVHVKEVDITGRNTGTGAMIGASAGGATGYQFGNGSGQAATAIAGVVIGAIAGSAIEQAAANQKGYEYVVVTEHKKTKTIVQYQNPEDVVFRVGDRVMIQTKGTYQRVLPTDNLPTEIKRPKGISIID